MKRLWPALAALAAIAFIAGLASHGERRPGGLVAFEAKGFLADLPVEAIRDVELAAPDRRRSFRRGADGAWDGASAEAAARLEAAVALLRRTAPERRMTAADTEGAAMALYGLDPPGLVVTVRGPSAPMFRIGFGGANPLGLSRYAQVEGREGVWLVPGHLARAWEAVMAPP